jgi:flagellar biosynthesis anti-sigma factor FlgM
MTTRIDGNQGTPIHPQVDRTDAGRSGERTQKQGAPGKPEPKTDRVEVSEGAAFVNEVVHAANQVPEVRMDKIEQAKKALADGTLGADAGKLADALIDHMLDDKK